MMHHIYWILDDDGNPKPTDDHLAWGYWHADFAKRQVARDEVSSDVLVSTVFLGLDHSFSDGPPVLWETMILGGPHDQYQDRYASRDEALAGHAKALELARGGTDGAA